MIFNKIEFTITKKFDLSFLINRVIHQKSTYYYKVTRKFYEIGSLKGIKEFKKNHKIMKYLKKTLRRPY